MHFSHFSVMIMRYCYLTTRFLTFLNSANSLAVRSFQVKIHRESTVMQNMQKYLRSSQMCKSSYTIPFRKMGNFSLTLGVDRQQYSF